MSPPAETDGAGADDRKNLDQILTSLVEALAADGAQLVERDLAGSPQDLAVVGRTVPLESDFAGFSETVASAGQPVELGRDQLGGLEDGRRAFAVPVSIQHRVAAVLLVNGDAGMVDLASAGSVLSDAAERVGLVQENAALRVSLERAMAQILERDERMLGRIGLDIHDGPTQQLSVALLEVQLLDAELAEAARQGTELPEALLPAMERIYETVGGALHEMRELIGHLRPAQFEDRALPEILGDAISAFENRSGVAVESRFDGAFPRNGISITQRITFYRVLQEALANAHRHGDAGCCVVEVVEDAGGIRLSVTDDGSGFDIAQALRPRAGTPMARFGLHGIRDRAELLGGDFDLASTIGEGSRISVFLPRWERPEDGDGD